MTYRVGNHQPQNVYRDDQYIGVMFTAEDAAAVVDALNHRTATRAAASKTAPPAQPRLAFTVEEAAAMLGIGRTKAFELVSTGDLPSVRIGRHRRVRQSDITAYVDKLGGQP